MASRKVIEADAVAQRFVAARRDDQVLHDYPGGVMPATLDEGYRVQDAALALDGRPVLGWKVGRIAEPVASAVGSTRLAGPIFSIAALDDHDDEAEVAVLAGFAAVEGELLARIAPGAAAARARGEQAGLIDGVHLGVEVASSPFPGINAHGPAVTVSDFGNNLSVVRGPRLDLELSETINAEMVVTIDGAVAGRGRPVDMLGGPVEAVAFLVDHILERGLGDPAGLWVSCGAVTGVHKVRPGNRVVVSLLGKRLHCRTVAATGKGSE